MMPAKQETELAADPTIGNSTPPRDARWRRAQRLTSSAAFAEIYEQGRSWRGRTMVLWLRAGTGTSLKVGVVASRASIGNAVQRNRARRRMREAFRLNQHRVQGTGEAVLMARHTINRARWPEIVEDLLALARKAGILREQP